jgi:VWFA-related protein
VLTPSPSPCRPLVVFIVVAFLVFQSRPSTAQSGSTHQSPSQESFQFQVESNLVLVRVVVRDKNGNPIRGLTKGDFRLLDQGKEQTISQFEEVAPGESPSSRAIAPATPAATRSPAVGREQRYIAFYFDDLNSSAGDLMQARDAADRYLTTSLGPNDRVAIFTTEKMLSDFTSDSRQIHEALMQLHASTRGPANEHPCPDLSDYQAYEILHTNDLSSDAWRTALAEAAACPVKIFAGNSKSDPTRPDPAAMQPIRMLAQRVLDQAQTLTRANLQQIEQVVKAIAPAPGERSVVLVSPGFLSESEQCALDRIIDRALRAQIVINSLDPKGLAILLRESDASRNTTILPDPHASQARYRLDVSKEFAGADVLAEVAQGTGGEFFNSDNDLKAGFAALTEDPPHYILAFSPQKVKWDGKFHALKVSFTTREKGLSIQARRGYFAVASDSKMGESVAAAKKTAAGAPAPEPRREPNPPSNSAPRVATESGPASTADSQPASSPAPESAVAEATSAENPPDTHEIAPMSRANAKPFHFHRGTNRVSVDQLEQFLADAHAKSDAELAKELTHLELSERLDSPALLRLEASLPGDQSRQVLAAQADVAAFLKPPAAVAALPATPSADDQRQWLKLATDYVTNALHKLPNFLATRDVTRFADSPARRVMGTFYSYEPLHAIERLQATVLYRGGRQVVDSDRERSTGPESNAPGMVIDGEFGPILGTVLTDASKTSILWSRWEPGASGPVAVYRFAVPGNKSHYEVEYCCVNGIGLYKQISAYHGEITIDPATGSVLRIAIQADLGQAYPLTRADLVVEYGPVEIGGKSYICPVRSVGIMMAYTKAPDAGLELPQVAGMSTSQGNTRELPVQIMINDIAFRQYHLFRSDSRILPASD